VGNLAWSVSWQDLKDHMKSHALEVLRVNVLTAPDGRSKGCAIVEFATAEAAQQAVLTLNDSELGGRQIFVREDRETGANFGGRAFSTDEQAKSRRVYVGNLSWEVSWQDLKDHMRQAGEVIHAEVITERTGRSKGCGIVEYSTPEQAQEAISTLTDSDLKGRMIFVREDRETASQAGGPPTHNVSVYIRNLSPHTSWQDLKDHMRKAGNVDSATILTDAAGQPMGCGVVVYQRSQDAARAIRDLQNSELNGWHMYIREDRVNPGRGGGGRGASRRPGRGRGGGRGGRSRGGGPPAEGTQLFVSNLSLNTSWRELKDHFRQCGNVKRAEVKTAPDGSSKGFGVVQFFTKEEAEEAMNKLNGSELMDREIEVRPDQRIQSS
jgi:RNA recognition motif-containing protein